jgi:hypothetical protein
MKRKLLLAVALPATAAILVSCGGTDDGTGPGDADAPTVTGTTPADGATDVGLIQRIEVVFSEAMDESTIDETTFDVTARGLSGQVDYDEGSMTATFIPDTLYAAQSSYDVEISDQVEDEGGHSMEDPYAFSFETGELDCDHLDDYLEPNDAMGEPATIDTGKTYQTLAICGDDIDYCAFTVDDTVKITATVTMRHAESAGIGLSVMRDIGGGAGRTLDLETGEEISVHYTFLPGTCLVVVDGANDPVYALYDLVLRSGEPCRDDAYEDNEFQSEATPIEPDSLYTDLRGCYQDRDNYSFQVEEGWSMTVTLTIDPASDPAFRQFKLTGPYGEIDGYDGDDSPVSLSAIAAETGTYYTWVTFYQDDVIYELELEIVD